MDLNANFSHSQCTIAEIGFKFQKNYRFNSGLVWRLQIPSTCFKLQVLWLAVERASIFACTCSVASNQRGMRPDQVSMFVFEK